MKNNYNYMQSLSNIVFNDKIIMREIHSYGKCGNLMRQNFVNEVGVGLYYFFLS